MPAVKIKVRGNTGKTKATEDEAPKSAPARRTRSTAKRGATAKESKAPTRRSPGRPRQNQRETAKAASLQPAHTPQRRNSTGVDPRTEARVLKLVQKMGERRAKAEAEHKEAINALHTAAQEALEAGVSMAKVSDASGISRQWLYKMGDFAGRTNGNGDSKPAAKPAAKSSAPQRRSTARKSTTTRQAQKSGGSRRRVAIRSAG